MSTTAKPRAQPKPPDAPKRELALTWVCPQTPEGYGVLLVSWRLEGEKAWRQQREFFVRPSNGRQGTTWEMSELEEGAGVVAECVVDLAGVGCTCEDWVQRGRCLHAEALGLLKREGRL